MKGSCGGCVVNERDDPVDGLRQGFKRICGPSFDIHEVVYYWVILLRDDAMAAFWHTRGIEWRDGSGCQIKWGLETLVVWIYHKKRLLAKQ